MLIDVSTRKHPLAVARIDLRDFDLILGDPHHWGAAQQTGKPIYATRLIGRKRQAMHRVILGIYDPLILCDHRDRDGLHNRRENLRTATPTQNCQNRTMNHAKSVRYKGVFFQKERDNFLAKITVNRRQINLGRYDAPEAAARAYDRAAVVHFGEFAVRNFT